MKQYLIVIADTNDGDYVTRKTELKNPEIVPKLQAILAKIVREKLYGGGHTKRITWETNEISNVDLWVQHPELTQEECEFLDNHVPHGEYGIHTIESIDLLEVVNEIKLL